MGKILIIKNANFYDVRVDKIKTIEDKISINLIASPEEGGIVSGSGNYFEGETVQISATANSSYKFTKWSDDNLESTRTIIVSENDSTYTAFFEERGWETKYKEAKVGIGAAIIDTYANLQGKNSIKAYITFDTIYNKCETKRFLVNWGQGVGSGIETYISDSTVIENASVGIEYQICDFDLTLIQGKTEDKNLKISVKYIDSNISSYEEGIYGQECAWTVKYKIT